MNRIAVFACVLLATVALPVSAQSLDSCKTDASQTRYAAEFECYEGYGPRSGNWRSDEHRDLDACLADVESIFSFSIEDCNELYLVEGPPFDVHGYTSFSIITALLIWGIFF